MTLVDWLCWTSTPVVLPLSTFIVCLEYIESMMDFSQCNLEVVLSLDSSTFSTIFQATRSMSLGWLFAEAVLGERRIPVDSWMKGVCERDWYSQALEVYSTRVSCGMMMVWMLLANSGVNNALGKNILHERESLIQLFYLMYTPVPRRPFWTLLARKNIVPKYSGTSYNISLLCFPVFQDSSMSSRPRFGQTHQHNHYTHSNQLKGFLCWNCKLKSFIQFTYCVHNCCYCCCCCSWIKWTREKVWSCLPLLHLLPHNLLKYDFLQKPFLSHCVFFRIFNFIVFFSVFFSDFWSVNRFKWQWNR